MQPMNWSDNSYYRSAPPCPYIPPYVPPEQRARDAGEERETITRELADLFLRIRKLANSINQHPAIVEAEISYDAHVIEQQPFDL